METLQDGLNEHLARQERRNTSAEQMAIRDADTSPGGKQESLEASTRRYEELADIMGKYMREYVDAAHTLPEHASEDSHDDLELAA